MNTKEMPAKEIRLNGDVLLSQLQLGEIGRDDVTGGRT